MINIEILLGIILIILFGIMWILAIIGNHIPAKKRTITYKTFPATHIRKPYNEKWDRSGIIIHYPDPIKIERLDHGYDILNMELRMAKAENRRQRDSVDSLQWALTKSEEEVKRLRNFEEFTTRITNLPNCTSCDRGSCHLRPGIGEGLRYNCPLYRAIIFRKEN